MHTVLLGTTIADLKVHEEKDKCNKKNSKNSKKGQKERERKQELHSLHYGSIAGLAWSKIWF